MSESFSDLWTSTNPVKSQQPQNRTLEAAANAPTNVALRAVPDAFSMLALAGSRPNSRPITPSNKHTPVTSKNTTDGDAFGGLVSFGNKTSRDGGLTIAERAAKAERERKERIEKDGVTFNVQGSFWDKYEDLPTGDPIPDALVKPNNLWDLDLLAPEQKPSSEQLQLYKSMDSSNNSDTWDLDFLSSKPLVNGTTPATVPTTDIFDMDHLDTLGTLPLSHSLEPPRANTPGSFDFGDREDQLLGAIDSLDEVDILDSPAKSVEAGDGIISKSPPHTIPASPPLHTVGRIVEMGFSVEQAKVALAATSTGLDADAALEILLQQGASASSEERGGEVMETLEVERISRRRQGSSRAMAPPTHSSPLSQQSESLLINQQGLQEQADKLLAQASMIGRTMFSRANAFWKESREQVGKAYQEQRSGLGAEAGIGKGRPRWMDNARIGEEGTELPADESQGRLESRRLPTQSSRSTPDPRRSEQYVSLLAIGEPVYRSPARRRPPAMASSSTTLSPPPISTPTTLPLIVRPSVDAPPSALAASATHKAAATEHFKLGRFAEAAAAYSRAIDALPASHLRIPLYNNRALTRLRTGEYKGTINDTTEVLRIVTGDLGIAWHPGREEAELRDSFRDEINKALRRRAEAYEGLEKWRDAVSDWERLSAAPWVGVGLKGDAIKGADRCRQIARDGFSPMISPKMSSKPKPKPQSESAPARISPARPSEAVTRVRAANAALEKEDQGRHDLKDVVDARLVAWRSGKENNLRALIASLDVVLSPTFGWQTVGMSELVSPGQVKVKYTKAIAKLHPDKLDANNTTLEERMVANSVFGTLNEAWHAFR